MGSLTFSQPAWGINLDVHALYVLRHAIAVIQPVICTLKMESVYKYSIFGLKMKVKNGLENLFEIPAYGKLFFLTSYR